MLIVICQTRFAVAGKLNVGRSFPPLASRLCCTFHLNVASAPGSACALLCSADVVAAVCHSRDRNASSIRQQGAGKRLLEAGRREGVGRLSQTMRAAARLIGRQHVCCCVVLLLCRFAVAIHAQLTCLTAVGIVVGCMPHACLLAWLAPLAASLPLA